MFSPPWWLRNRHMQSCFASLFPYHAKVDLVWEELRLPDGDFLDLVWAGLTTAPIVILLHGLEGSVNSHYIQLMIDALVKEGWQIVVMHYRTCSGRINRLPQSYNGGDTSDLAYLINILSERFPSRKMVGIGFSLGGNMLLRYAATHRDAPLQQIVAVSTPYEMSKSADYLSSFYQRVLLRTMKRKARWKIKAGQKMPVTLKQLRRLKTMREFDAAVTCPLYGLRNVDEYYESVSNRHMLKDIKHPTLIIHAMDDPFVPPNSIPHAYELSPSTEFELIPTGGHVGFVQGNTPWHPQYWLRERLLQALKK